ncbi:NAD(P)H-flavin reductase [Thalassotalea aquiviva]|uniref:NAD(P)H-flavin reductase n=1 Tax=Thalassotalea aquiviva TaxID=3242415 RepID=UPI00352B6F7C
MNTIDCKVESITPLTETVYQILLKTPEPVDYEAGQYLNVVMSADDKRPFSIASSPGGAQIELQIGAFAADSWAMQVIDHMRQNDSVKIEIPLGNAQVRANSPRPIILLAGGTGFSYVKSILGDLVRRQVPQQVFLYWGLRDVSACYQLEDTAKMVAQLPQGSFIPVVETANGSWQGEVGKVHQPLLDRFDDLSAYDIYMAGRFDMVGFLRNEFIEQGANVDHMYADAFAFL